MAPHAELEARLAAFKGTEAALLFGSGYLANVGVVSALARGGTVFSDALNHASIIDGCRLAQADVVVYRHRDVEHLAQGLASHPGPKLIVTDGVFSMDGDVAPLRDVAALAAEHGATLVVDDAHGTGVLGPGRPRRWWLPPASTPTWWSARSARRSAPTAPTSRAVRRCADLLLNTARSFIFSTALPPSAVAAAQAALDVLEAEPDRPRRLLRQRRPAARGARAPRGGDADPPAHHRRRARRRARAAEGALADGVFAQAIRPPTVPVGTSRLRLSVMATHTPEQIRRAAAVLRSPAGVPRTAMI